jgi:hypothetical protein
MTGVAWLSAVRASEAYDWFRKRAKLSRGTHVHTSGMKKPNSYTDGQYQLIATDGFSNYHATTDDPSCVTKISTRRLVLL